MKKISSFIVKIRYYLLGLFLILVGLSGYLMTRVNINYNLMQYLDKKSESTVALTKMEDEFGSVGECQVLVSNVKFSDAKDIKVIIEGIDGVSSVVFASSEEDTEYYNTNTNDALYKVFLTTGNFDTASYKTLDNIRDTLNDYVINLNGGSVESEFLSNALERDMVIILIVVIVVVFIILAITSTSWLEPVLFLIIAGGAILINMGSNILLNYIPYISNSMSFITKSIAAVMQLALSMDYSIVLLHAYRKEKEDNDNVYDAMANALAKSFAPVSSSSITTIAGLVALMFMSFSIGFDVGLVLAKGILISLLSVFLFMPGLLLLFDKLLAKTAHKPLDLIIKEKINNHVEKKKNAKKKVFSLAKFQDKTKYLIPALALLLIIVGAAFNFKSEYSFTLEASTDKNSKVNVDNKKITDEFGTQNTLVVLLPKENNDRNSVANTEKEISEYLLNYKYDNKNVISSAQGYSTYGVYDNLTAEEFAKRYLDKNSYNANVRGIKVLYSYMEKDGLTKENEKNELTANVYDVIEYASKNNGARLIANESQELIDKVYYLYNKKLTSSELASANSLNETIINNIYEANNKDLMTTYEVLKFVNDNDYANLALSNIQTKIDNTYNELVSNHVFNSDGSVNETTVSAMEKYCAAVETGILDINDNVVNATYTKYKQIIIKLDKDTLIATYPFINSDTANLLLNGNDTIPNYLAIQAISLKQISKAYGIELQKVINLKYNEIPNKDLLLTKEDVVLNYGIDSDAIDLLFRNNVTNEVLFDTLSETSYYNNEKYIDAMDNKFKSNYEAFSNFESDNYIRVIYNLDMPKSGDASFMVINDITDNLYKNYNGIEVVSETFVYSQIKDVFNKDIILVNLISFISIVLIIAITFRSYFIPLLLTLLIQGAIWITMGISTLFGHDTFFICYIVVMCVQMGATIDYGILLTNSYIENRKIMTKIDAMKHALESSITTILTSGSILVLATLIIGLVSKVSIVSDLGLLLSRGCLISVLMILIILPQCLLLFDKVIEHTQRKVVFFHEYEKVKTKTIESK